MTMTVHRAIAWNADDAALDGRWWADDEDACRAVVCELYGGWEDDCKVATRTIDTTGYAEHDMAGELYEPGHEEAWTAEIAAGAPGVVITDCVMTESGEPCTVVLIA